MRTSNVNLSQAQTFFLLRKRNLLDFPQALSELNVFQNKATIYMFLCEICPCYKNISYVKTSVIWPSERVRCCLDNKKFANWKRNFSTKHFINILAPARPWLGDYKTSSLHMCVYPFIMFLPKPLHLIHLWRYLHLAKNIYGYKNISVHNFGLILKKKLAIIANYLKIIKKL